MVRQIVVIGGNSHKQLTEGICDLLGIPPAKAELSKFSCGETKVEIKQSVRGKDVYIVQSGGGNINDHLMELLIAIHACKIASANRIIAILPLFPYSRQTDIPYDRAGAPLMRTMQTRPQTPFLGPREPRNGLMSPNTLISLPSLPSQISRTQTEAAHDVNAPEFELDDHFPKDAAYSKWPENQVGQRGYRPWLAQPGKLIADLLTAAGTDTVITMDLHDAQYEGFFDIPVDHLYGRNLLIRYIIEKIPNHHRAVIVSPDAGGAKRAAAIAGKLGMTFALIHKVKQSSSSTNTKKLVGDVKGRTAILIDDLADTCTTILRAGRMLKKAGATQVYALLTHGIFSGDSIKALKGDEIDKIVVTNSIDQRAHQEQLGDKLKVLDVSDIFADAIRRVRYGESSNVIFQDD